jgi:hypothetical protein
MRRLGADGPAQIPLDLFLVVNGQLLARARLAA